MSFQESSAALLKAAETYTSALTIGDHIVDAVDQCIIGKFRHLIPALLAKRGLVLEHIRHGVYVVSLSAWGAPVLDFAKPLAVECTKCRGNWFSCEHGVGLTIGVRWEAR